MRYAEAVQEICGALEDGVDISEMPEYSVEEIAEALDRMQHLYQGIISR